MDREAVAMVRGEGAVEGVVERGLWWAGARMARGIAPLVRGGGRPFGGRALLLPGHGGLLCRGDLILGDASKGLDSVESRRPIAISR